MARVLPRQVDTVVVGNGPSALILSYILNGHIPIYDLESPHPDPILHEKLKKCKDLLSAEVDHLTEHFNASRFSYSTQALPVNVLLDTLIRPLGETDDVDKRTCIKWCYNPSKSVPHIVVGKTLQTGGQWVDNPVKASWDIGTLSYAGMLSLPGYTFDEHYLATYRSPLPFYLRPSRREIAHYLASYPEKVGISDNIYNGQILSGISRHGAGFHIASHDIFCDHLILASGIFTKLIPPPPLLRPLVSLPTPTQTLSAAPVLIVGSGFSAADVIISIPPEQKIIHLFKWAPSTSPSPLRACHQQAYPEYAGVYRKMKRAALALQSSKDQRPKPSRAPSSQFDFSRDWDATYEGLPNTVVTDVELQSDGATLTLQSNGEQSFQRKISNLVYVIGRRGSFDFIDSKLRRDVCPDLEASSCLTGHSMREKANEDLEVAENVFIIGSLTGDSLIRFAYGGCTYAAGKIMAKRESSVKGESNAEFRCSCKISSSKNGLKYLPGMNGLDGHESHIDEVLRHGLPLDRRKSEI